MLMDHDLLAERGVTPNDGGVAHNPMVGRGRCMDDHRGAAMEVNWVSEGMPTDEPEVAYGVMRDDAMARDEMGPNRNFLVNDPFVDRRMGRLRGGRHRNRERDRHRRQDDQQPRRKPSSHGVLTFAFRTSRLTTAVVSIPSARGRANPR
jgi:hypothetical protein